MVHSENRLGVGAAESESKAPLSPWENPNLDLLRTCAVMLVFTHHLLEFFGILRNDRPGMHLGRWGVLLFFVHTSIVLMLSLERQSQQNYRSGYWVFLLRRSFRLFPLSLLVVAVVSTFHWGVGIFDNQQFGAAHFDTKTILSNVFLVQNLTHTDSVMATLWTLPYEIQMYLVLPALFLLTVRFRSVTPLLLIWAGCAIVAKLSLLGTRFADLPNFAPCFIAGVIGYKLSKGRLLGLPFLGWPVLLGATTAYVQFHTGFPTNWLLCLLVGGLAMQFRELGPGLLRRACQLIARYSYGIYLTHLLCIWLAFVVLAALPLYARWLVFIVSASASPVILYHTVEAPMIALGARLARRWSSPAPLHEYDAAETAVVLRRG